MALQKALAILAVALVLATFPQDLIAAEDSVDTFDPTVAAATKEVDDGGITLAIVGIIASTLIALVAYGEKKVVAGPVEITANDTHLHVGDERDVLVTFPFSLGNINPWDDGGYIDVSVFVESRNVRRVLKEFSGPVQDTLQTGVKVEAKDLGIAPIHVQAGVFGEDAGFFSDTFAYRESIGDEQAAVQHPLGPLTLAPPGGESFDHSVGVNHILTVENHSKLRVLLVRPRVNSATQLSGWAEAGQDFGPPTSSQPLFGNVNHTATHAQQIEPVSFLWGVDKFLMFLKTGDWNQSASLTNGTDFCVLEGENTAPEAPVENDGWLGQPRVSSGCFTPGFLQRSDLSHGLSVGGVTVTIINHPSVGPAHDLTTDATGQFCWTDLNLAEFVDVTINSDGNVPEIEQYTYEGVPLEVLENGDAGLVMNYVELAVPRIDGVMEASDGGPLHALVYSRRSGYPDHLIGVVSNGAFTLEGYYMLEFDSYSSELVFVPRPPFNRTLSPAAPIVVQFDPTLTGGIDIGTVTFNIAPRENSPSITVRGTFLDQDLLPIQGLEIEFHHGAVLVASASTNASGFFDVSVPNGPATVSSPNLEDLDLEPLPPEVVDLGLNGMTVLDIGNRRLFWNPALFSDDFESGDTGAWASATP